MRLPAMLFSKPILSKQKKGTKLTKGVLCLSVLLFLSACGKSDKPKIDTELLSAGELYGAAKESMLDAKWADAITQLAQLEARYPYGEYALQAQLDSAYAYYKNDEDGLAIAAADRFLNLNPTHPRVDYAYYIKGLASFHEEEGLYALVTGRTNLSDKDPKSIMDARTAFTTIVEQYPDSEYAFDANKRVGYLNSALADHEIGIARFYYQRGAYVAAANRAKSTLEAYAEQPQVEDALGVMYHSYRKMGMADLAQDTKRVLEANYPQSGYLRADKKVSRSGAVGQFFQSLID